MKIINFSHPLTNEQLHRIEEILNQKIRKTIEIADQIDPNSPLSPQIEKMLDATGLSPKDWQAQPLLINLPALNFSAAVMLVQLHGRMGYFPSILRLRPIQGAVPLRFEVAEILNLQSIREETRKRRV